VIKKLGKYGATEHFRLLVEQVTEYAMFLLDPDGHVTTWNPGAQRIKGYAPDEIIGSHFSKFYRPEDVWKCDYELDVARREGRVEDEGWRVRKDGTLFWANVVITCLHDDEGHLIGYGKVTRDLTERRRQEQQVLESEQRFRLLVESVRDYAIFLLDEQGNVSTWNIGAQRIKGYAAQEIIGHHFSRFYPEDDVRAGKCDMELRVAMAEGRFEDEGWRVRKDGSRFWANVVITALFNTTTGKHVGFAKVTRDLTERRAAEEQRLRLGRLAQERISALGELSGALASASTTKEVALAVIEKGIRLAHADTCTLYVLDDTTQVLELIAERGCNPDVIAQVQRITPDGGNPTYAIGTGGAPSVWIESYEQYLQYFPALASQTFPGERVRAFACVPLVAESRILGMIGVGLRQERVFSSDEREFIETGARQCAQALARARRLDSERRAAAEVARLQASLATTLRSIGDAVIATDAQGAITLMNTVAESLTGYGEDDARGRSIGEVFRIENEHTRAPVPNPVDKVIESGAIVGLANHTVLIARDGREIPIDDSAAPIRARDSAAIEGVVLVFRDISDRKREEEWRTHISEASSVLAESLDYEANLTRVAQLTVPRLADLCAIDIVLEGEMKRLAVAHNDPTKAAILEELHAKYPPERRAVNGVPHVLRTGRAVLYREIPEQLLVEACEDEEHLRLVRELRLRSVLVVPLVAGHRILGALTFAYSESESVYREDDLHMASDLARRCANSIENARLYASEQNARKHADIANRAKDEFLAIVSHELRTPLNAIMGWAKLLSEPDFEEQRRTRAVQTIERNAVAMAQLIEDLLDMSRMISGKMRLEIQAVNVTNVVEAALDTIRPAAAARNVELVPVLDPTVPAITGDPTRLQQVVWNLLSNAIKFTSKGGRVRIVTEVIDSAIEITVSDTGRGIAPDFLPYVFEAFRQEDASSTRSRGGLGLGLAITKQLVELHGGSIQASSAGEGQGATFTVLLPVSAVSSQPDARHAPKLRAAAYERSELRGVRVLVVDDEEDARMLISTVLENCGCRVTTASSARQALDRIALEAPDMLLSDIGMPEQDGYVLIRKVRALPQDQGGAMPAAALTAYTRAEDRRRMLNAGYSMHLAKPVDPAELVDAAAALARLIVRA
jgi:PAS domain S-box-containing protein